MAGETVIADRYRLDRAPLGVGGMGTVWGALDQTLARRVAVKLVKSPDEELTRRFLRECRITAEMHHPGVPAVYDIGTHDGSPYLVMEFVDGRTVADLIAEEEGLPVGWAAAVAAQACAVLALAHRRRRVHRDLKPSNLMIRPDGSVKVLDFGLAGALEPADLTRITSTGQQLGTPAYMAPEQFKGEPVSPQTDLYALGCVLFEMLAGRPPYTGSQWQIMQGHTGRRPPRLHSPRGDVPAELRDLVYALLAKKPQDRPSGAGEVYTRLVPFLRDLGPLADAVRPAQGDPLRLYASIVARVGVAAAVPDTTAVEVPQAEGNGAPEPSNQGAGGEASPRKIELRYARDEARTLARHDRFTEATQTLWTAVEAAAAADGPDDPEVLSGRLQLAELLFEGADYAAAASEFRAVCAALSGRHGPDRELAFMCRSQEAACQAALGAVDEAIDLLTALIADEERVLGPDDDRTLAARLQLGRLLADTGDDRAFGVLSDLRGDLLRWRGADHPDVRTVEELLAGPHPHDP
ncbi:hypothetical protein Acsp04_47590 [Actinomadura sp. NBRC 104425]|uniref:serine/threonine-protein kinase n=1 Tax=Actinomadura sp. NBRC 104425 TaxID=3032204 RepID=UPI0024A045A3|nr:serine/threonine-protein kinase [Actinomadura sp. NBRC 104425]GLZ14524.1 hypothetical protein Acsp04_47590 [Actinomadura sp. NBRC 104425]